MVCCTLIAGLLALLFRPLIAWRANPLAWRPGAGPEETRSPRRAKSRWRSVAHAIDGIAFVARNEPNMRIHLVVAGLVLAAGFWLGIDASEWRWLILAITLVFCAEVFNTAVEQCCNAVSLDYHRAIKVAKDAAAGAVLIAALAAAVIGASVLLPHILSLSQLPQAFWDRPFCGMGR